MKKWIQSGLVLFGAVFFSVIAIELYQANTNHTKGTDAPVVTAEPPAKATAPLPAADSNSAQTMPKEAEKSQNTTTASANGQTASAASNGVSPEAAPAIRTGSAGSAAAVPADASSASQSPATSVTKGAPAATGNMDAAAPASRSSTKAAIATAGAPAQTKGSSAGSKKPKSIRHVVQKGETLYMLSRKYYGNNSNVARIAKYNGLSLEAQLKAGAVVFVPLLQ
ncbi:LysM peptidoglycan-binding domain-containing protein [Brevibacillus sp. GCM10020057]|uniref:LysM peptidoglycan-binding domain-containing protein n=1 Tax=Brevibacillus sp. GCM10020057 TaxID=3317327 RepID=UPI00363BEA7B